MKEFRRGLLATMPLAPGVIAFGLLYGMIARQAGFQIWEAWTMSLMVHAGSAQFVAVGMWETSAAVTIILTTLVINLRHLLMGASVAPYLRGLSRPWQAFLALWMSDESYALAIVEYEHGRGNPQFFLGCNVGIYVVWTTSGLIGVALGTAIPDPSGYGLGLIFPLAFLGLLSSLLSDRFGVAAALAAGGLAVLGACLVSGRWYMVTAGLLGATVGLLLEERRRV